MKITIETTEEQDAALTRDNNSGKDLDVFTQELIAGFLDRRVSEWKRYDSDVRKAKMQSALDKMSDDDLDVVLAVAGKYASQ